jgi:hypothetical protein
VKRPWTNRAAWGLLALTPFVASGALRGVLEGTGVIDDVDFRTGATIVVLTIIAVEVARSISDAGKRRWIRRSAAITPLRDQLAEMDRILAKYDPEGRS